MNGQRPQLDREEPAQHVGQNAGLGEQSTSIGVSIRRTTFSSRREARSEEITSVASP